SLECWVHEVNAAIGPAEAAGGVGEDEVAGVRILLSLSAQLLLGATEAVGQDHGRERAVPARRHVDVRVELDGCSVRFRNRADPLGRRLDVRRRALLSARLAAGA